MIKEERTISHRDQKLNLDTDEHRYTQTKTMSHTEPQRTQSFSELNEFVLLEYLGSSCHGEIIEVLKGNMKKSKKPIYLDVCVLSRPFDDQSFLRIRLETEAVNLMLLI